MEDVLLESIDDGVVTLTMNRPNSLNALNPPLMKALAKATARLAEDPDVRCVVLTGAGRGFCAGGDQKAALSVADQIAGQVKPDKKLALEHRVAWLRRSMEAARLLHQMRKPTIAMINGPCAGAGLNLAGACDLRLAAESAVFTTSFAKAGLSGDYGGTWFWTRILGTAKARELYLLSEKLGAQAAFAAGLVQRVVPDADLKAATMAMAKELAARPAAGIAYMKANLNAAEAESLESVLDREALTMMLSRQALIAARKASSSD